MKKETEKRILSVEDVLHLQSDKNKESKIMPNVDTSQYVLKNKPRTETVRSFVSTANITEEQRRQFHQGSNTAAKDRNAELAEKARQAAKVAEKHAENEAIERAKAAEEKAANTNMAVNELAAKIRGGNFDFNFGALIAGSDNLKEKI